jgi:hypothetical protein
MMEQSKQHLYNYRNNHTYQRVCTSFDAIQLATSHISAGAADSVDHRISWCTISVITSYSVLNTKRLLHADCCLLHAAR